MIHDKTPDTERGKEVEKGGTLGVPPFSKKHPLPRWWKPQWGMKLDNGK